MNPVKDPGPTWAPILPREEAVPALPEGVATLGWPCLPHECEVADGEHTPAARALRHLAVAVPEGVELLDVAELGAGLLLNPGAESGLERAMLRRQRAGGQRIAPVAAARRPRRTCPGVPPATHDEHSWIVLGDGDHHCGEVDRDGLISHLRFRPSTRRFLLLPAAASHSSASGGTAREARVRVEKLTQAGRRSNGAITGYWGKVTDKARGALIWLGMSRKDLARLIASPNRSGVTCGNLRRLTISGIPDGPVGGGFQ